VPHRTLTALAGILQPRVGLSKSRLETLSLIVIGMVSARTVNLGHIGCERPGSALIASTYRRLQRFFKHVALPEDWAAPILADLIGPGSRRDLVLDRTTWKIGTRDVNYLVLAVVTRRLRRRCSGPCCRGPATARARRASRSSGATLRTSVPRPSGCSSPIASSSAPWLEFLNDSNVPFAIRLREDLRVTDEAGHELTLLARVRLARRTRTFTVPLRGGRLGLVSERRGRCSRDRSLGGGGGTNRRPRPGGHRRGKRTARLSSSAR